MNGDFSDDFGGTIRTEVDVLASDAFKESCVKYSKRCRQLCGPTKHIAGGEDPLTAIPINSLWPHPVSIDDWGRRMRG